MFAINHNFVISAAHIPGIFNIIADKGSREFNDNLEWSLSDNIFSQICSKWGTPEIDLFASILNHKIKPYVSYGPDPGSSYIDSFSIKWNNMYVYAFPPFSLIWPILRKIQYESVEMILICPLWTTQSWFPKITEIFN